MHEAAESMSSRVRSVAVPRAHLGDTDAPDWRSDPHLLAILVRGVNRERAGREKDQFRRDELDERAWRAGHRLYQPAFTPSGAA